MNKEKKHTVLWSYLNSLPGIEIFKDEDYEKAKKHYWNVVYKQNYRRRRKAHYQTFNVTLNSKEFKAVRKVALHQNTSVTAIIKKAALANVEGKELAAANPNLDDLMIKTMDINGALLKIQRSKECSLFIRKEIEALLLNVENLLQLFINIASDDH
jgi:hypothetical protein